MYINTRLLVHLLLLLLLMLLLLLLIWLMLFKARRDSMKQSNKSLSQWYLIHLALL